MKITCQLCGTKFNLEKNDYRCPGCASVYGLDGKFEGSSNKTSYSNANQPEAIKDTKTKKGIKTIVITIEVIIIVFFILMPFLGKGYSKLRFEEQRVDQKPPIVEAYMNEPMIVGDYEITVTSCYIDDSRKWKLPDNYVVYAVEYNTERIVSEYTGQSLFRTVEIYLETEDGPTIVPIGNYKASDFMVYEEYKKVDDRLDDYIRYDGGILYFVVKDYEKIYGLCFDTYTLRKNDENYRELDKIYLMKALQWEVE